MLSADEISRLFFCLSLIQWNRVEEKMQTQIRLNYMTWKMQSERRNERADIRVRHQHFPAQFHFQRWPSIHSILVRCCHRAWERSRRKFIMIFAGSFCPLVLHSFCLQIKNVRNHRGTENKHTGINLIMENFWRVDGKWLLRGSKAIAHTRAPPAS